MSQQQEFECEYEREGEFGYGYGYRNEYAQPRNLNMPRCLRGLPAFSFRHHLVDSLV